MNKKLEKEFDKILNKNIDWEGNRNGNAERPMQLKIEVDLIKFIDTHFIVKEDVAKVLDSEKQTMEQLLEGRREEYKTFGCTSADSEYDSRVKTDIEKLQDIKNKLNI